VGLFPGDTKFLEAFLFKLWRGLSTLFVILALNWDGTKWMAVAGRDPGDRQIYTANESVATGRPTRAPYNRR
jgi:hypothetical protein